MENEDWASWTPCEWSGHDYHQSTATVRTCGDCGDSYEDDDDDRYMGSDSDFSDHALGIDY